MPSKNGHDTRRLLFVALVALVITTGLQLIRVMLPLWLYALRDRFGWNAIEIGVLAVGLFSLTFTAGTIARLFGRRRLLALTVILLLACRLLLQRWRGDPVGDMVLAMIGVVSFGVVLPLLAGFSHPLNHIQPRDVGVGVLFGLALDLALNGLYGTVDIAWHAGLAGWAPVVVLSAAGGAALWRLVSGEQFEPGDPATGAVAWLSVGPLIFFALLLTGNLAQLQTWTNWAPPLALGVLLATHLAGIATVWLAPAWRRIALPASAAVVTGLLLLEPVTGQLPRAWVVVLTTVLVQVTLAAFWLDGLSRFEPARDASGIGRLSRANGAGLLILVIALFAFYAGYDLRLPFPNSAVPAATFLIAVAASWRPRRTASYVAPRAVPTSLSLLLLAPLLLWASAARGVQAVDGPAAPSRSLRVMTYNLHAGFDMRGQMDLWRLAQTIEASGADIVALQEVSRGWVVNGSADMLTWLAARLDMHAAFVGTTGPLWGNAVLSRYPIVATEEVPLPPDNLLLGRAVLHVTIAGPDAAPIAVLATHYHHVAADSAIRVLQSEAIVAYRPPAERAILLGDLNALPDAPEMMVLAAAGWRDSYAVAGSGNGYTYSAADPARRIDYIWLSPDWSVESALVLPNAGSDHLAVLATVR